MEKHYTKACNFFNNPSSNNLNKNFLKLNGNSNFKFKTIELVSRRSRKTISLEYIGFGMVFNKKQHKRTYYLENNRIKVVDCVTSCIFSNDLIEIFFHFHPENAISLVHKNKILIVTKTCFFFLSNDTCDESTENSKKPRSW